MSPQPFRHVHADKAALYRAVMGTFVAARRRFLVHLRPEDVREAVREAVRENGKGDDSGSAPGEPPPLEELCVALDQLVSWGNLRADADTARVETIDDFYRRRLLYQLTPEGEAAETALDAYDRALGRRGELQAVALDDIRRQLRALRALLAEPGDDPARVHHLLRDLVAVFERLADNAQAFIASLRRTIELQDGGVDAFVAYKERLVSYLERFVGDLTRASHEISELLRSLPSGRVEHALRLAAEREARDALPGPGDDGGGGEHESELASRLQAWRARWSGLAAWFVGDRRRPSQARLLRRRARAAIPELLAVVAAINERRSTRIDRAADLRALARWFAEAPDDASCHRLWRAAFALHPARHLVVDSQTLDARAELPVPASTSWREAPPVVVSPRLRATGSHQRRGRPSRVRDRTEQKRYLAQLLRNEQAAFERARDELCTDGPVRLSALPELSEPAFDLLLSLLGDALAVRSSAGDHVRHVSPDGRLEIRLQPTEDGARASIATPRGTLRAPDFSITVTDVTVAGAATDSRGTRPSEGNAAWAVS